MKLVRRTAGLLAMLALLVSLAEAQDRTLVVEDELYEGQVLSDRSWMYYEVQPSEAFVTGTEYLLIKVMVESFASDPDIFISLINPYPDEGESTDWICAKKGSDTCVLHPSKVIAGARYYIGVRCVLACKFSFKAMYSTPILLEDSTRTQFRIPGHSSQLFQYLVPQDTEDGFTNAVAFQVQTDEDYTPLDIYVSVNDEYIHQVEDPNIQLLQEKGKGFRLTQGISGWCTRCYIYILVDVIVDARYYVEVEAVGPNPSIFELRPWEKYINAQEQACYSYFVSGAGSDLVVTVSQYEGRMDIYASARTLPTSPLDTSVDFKATVGAQTFLLVTSENRLKYGYQTGTYYVCFYAYESSSVKLLVDESDLKAMFTMGDDQVTNIHLYALESFGFAYTNGDMVSKSLSVNIHLTTTATSSANGRQTTIVYRYCTSAVVSSCELTDSEKKGTNMLALTKVTTGTVGSYVLTAQIAHSPESCTTSPCYLMFGVYNPDTTNSLGVQASLTVGHSQSSPNTLALGNSYRNVKDLWHYEHYEFNAGEDSSILESITFKLQSFTGDADLLVSLTEQFPTLSTAETIVRTILPYEAISISRSLQYTFASSIYVAVYCNTLTAYELTLDEEYLPERSTKLVEAKPLVDGVGDFIYMSDEYLEDFFSFAPWWADFENRRVIFVAEIIFNKVYFYLEHDEYPRHYTSIWHDFNDMFSLAPTDEGYSLDGAYYIRVRPDFGLYDLISDRQYIFNFYAFSQEEKPESHIDLTLDNVTVGFANSSSTFYRFYMLDSVASYDFTMDPLSGSPDMYIKVSTTSFLPTPDSVISFDIPSSGQSPPGDDATEVYTVTYDQRVAFESDCINAGYHLEGGNKKCAFFIGIFCDSACAYNLTITRTDETNTIPNYLLNKQYYTGHIGYNKYQYFYLPISNLTGGTAIVVNKTHYEDLELEIMFIRDSSIGYDRWAYPNSGSYHSRSASLSVTESELIEICSSSFFYWCSTSNCMMLLAVKGTVQNVESRFRIIVYTDDSQLNSTEVRNGTLKNVGDYMYYWFVNNGASTTWSTVTSLSLLDAQDDADIYVSFGDGRLPTMNDYDWKSESFGGETLVINSTDDFFVGGGYAKTVGIFVVGVRAKTPNVNYAVTNFFSGTTNLLNTMSINQIETYKKLSNLQVANKAVKFFYWENWGAQDFSLNVKCTVGSVNVYISAHRELDYRSAVLSTIPQSVDNAFWSKTVVKDSTGTYTVTKNEVEGIFCYFCTYWVKVEQTTTTVTSNFDIEFTIVPDDGSEQPLLTKGVPNGATLATTASYTTRKFILQSKKDFEIETSVSSGTVEIYVGLDPNQRTVNYLWRAQQGLGIGTISILQSDPNFHIGAYYYITVVATAGKSTISFLVKQTPDVIYLENAVSYKQVYTTQYELVKYYAFATPTTAAGKFYRVYINLEAYTDHFYPTVYVDQINSTSAISTFSALSFPDPSSYYRKFGNSFQGLALNPTSTYVLTGQTTEVFTYLVIAVVSKNYGFTDNRKPEFGISATGEQTSTLLVGAINEQATNSDTRATNGFEVIWSHLASLLEQFKGQFERFIHI